MCDEVVEFGCRHKRLDIVPARPARPLGIAQNLAAASGQQPLRRRGRRVRHAHRDMIDRLEQNRLRLGEALGNSLPCGDLKRHIGAIHRMKGAVDQGHRDIDDRIAERTFLQRFFGPVFDRRDILLWHRAAHDLVVENEAFAAGARGDVDLDVGELPVPAALPLVPRVLPE